MDERGPWTGPAKAQARCQAPARSALFLSAVRHRPLPREDVKGTVMFRPQQTSLLGSARTRVAQELLQRPGVAHVRVNVRRNIVAADVIDDARMAELLSVTTIAGVPVVAHEPADKNTSAGTVYAVDGDLTEAELAEGLESSVLVESARLVGRTLYLRFRAPSPPEYVAIYKLRFSVRARRPRPLQC